MRIGWTSPRCAGWPTSRHGWRGWRWPLLVALRPGEPAATSPSLLALRDGGVGGRPPRVVERGRGRGDRSRGRRRPCERGAVRCGLDGERRQSPLRERAGAAVRARRGVACRAVRPLVAGREEIARRVVARVRGLDPHALASRAGARRARRRLRAAPRRRRSPASRWRRPRVWPPASFVWRCWRRRPSVRFIHPIVRDALEASLGSDARDAAHRAAARSACTPTGHRRAGRRASRRGAAGRRWLGAGALARGRAGGDAKAARRRRRPICWAARWPSRPRVRERVDVLREAARAEASAGQGDGVRAAGGGAATRRRIRASAPRSRSRWPRRTRRCSGGWTRSMSSNGRWLELGEADEVLAARLEGELVVCGLHDARRASRVAPVLERLSSRSLTGSAAEALARRAGDGDGARRAGRRRRPALRWRQALSRAGSRTENWDTRAALLWSLIAAERFETVEAALEPMVAEVHRLGKRARPGRHLQHARPAPPAPRCTAGGRRGRTRRAAGAAGGRLRARPPVRRDGARGRRGRGRRARRGRGAARAPAPGRLAGGRRHRVDPGRPRPATARPGAPGRGAGRLRRRARRCSAPSSGEPRCGTSGTCTPAPVRRRRCCDWASASARVSWPRPSWPTSGCSERRARSGSHCASPGSPRAATRGLELPRRIRGRPPELAGAARAGALAGRARGGAAPCRPARGRARAALRGARPRCPLRRPPARRSRARGAQGGRSPPATSMAHRRRGADAERAAHRAAGGRGRSNREIAHELYVTLKTVEGHLSRAYPKLGVEGRGQLARAARGRKDQGGHPLANDRPPRRPYGRIPATEGGIQ